ncbi:ABC transporter substrate-binding protein [bacterium]|uniref:ABC transporter substrate-binding protein n=1 Tax=Lachnospiraceae TaxID=186803 RepID=UPI002A33BF44|nr:ABC transporter substrate-binding protein [bacterium]MDD6516059.1 ABC transporter substrate-binding protein [bacterium]MDY4193417.1 ABC transporter substrate-binding protein [Bariatricus sp.]MDY4504638.1 ABC transporter substrate-binding protein [Bariatricus sp.]
MRNVKKWLAVAMVAAMTVSMAAGCGSKSEGEKSSGSDSEVIKIGAIGPVTGAAAVYGQAVKNGAELAVEEINAAGGINGAQVEFKFEDDEHDAEKAVNAYNNLKDWGMQALLGTVTSAPCVAVGEVANQDNMFLLTPSGTAVECVQYDNAFRVCFSDPMQGLESAKYIGENGLASKVAVIYDSSDVYSTGIYEAFVKEAANQDFEVVAAEAFTSESKTDFSVQLQKAKDSGAELVFLPFYYSEASLVLKQAAGMNYNPIFFGCDGMDGILAVEGFDANLANNLMFLSPFTPTSTDEAIQKFVTAFKDKYGDTPNQFAADAYDGIYAMKAAMEKADVKPGMASSDVCDGLKSAMVEIEIDGVTAKGLTWEASGEPSKEPMVVKIENGDYAVVE